MNVQPSSNPNHHLSDYREVWGDFREAMVFSIAIILLAFLLLYFAVNYGQEKLGIPNHLISGWWILLYAQFLYLIIGKPNLARLLRKQGNKLLSSAYMGLFKDLLPEHQDFLKERFDDVDRARGNRKTIEKEKFDISAEKLQRLYPAVERVVPSFFLSGKKDGEAEQAVKAIEKTVTENVKVAQPATTD